MPPHLANTGHIMVNSFVWFGTFLPNTIYYFALCSERFSNEGSIAFGNSTLNEHHQQPHFWMSWMIQHQMKWIETGTPLTTVKQQMWWSLSSFKRLCTVVHHIEKAWPWQHVAKYFASTERVCVPLLFLKSADPILDADLILKNNDLGQATGGSAHAARAVWTSRNALNIRALSCSGAPAFGWSTCSLSVEEAFKSDFNMRGAKHAGWTHTLGRSVWWYQLKRADPFAILFPQK